ncbi:MAG: CDP-alcohol phosphatidyltransferase family protein [Methyloligellaceae bacterium]
MNIPNLITVGRIFLVPLVVWLIISGNMQLAVVTFVIAGLSDALDGYLAKRYNWQTVLGAYLDPVADKALLMSIYVVLGIFGHLPVWLVIAVVSRDVIIIGAILLSWIVGRPVKVHPLYISKANTAGQIFLAALVMADLGFSLGLAWLTGVVIWVTGALTVLSAGAYLVSWLRHMASYETVSEPVERPAFEGATAPRSRHKERVHGS